MHSMYYIAVVCPEAINNRVMKYKQWMKEQFGCIIAMRSPAHITLVPPFWISNEKENLLHETLESFPGPGQPARIELAGFSHFGKRVLFVGVKENANLVKLKNQAEDFFRDIFPLEIKKDTRDFHPHITIANRDMKPPDFDKAWAFFSHQSFNDSFTANTISLLKLEEGKWHIVKDKAIMV